MADYAIHDTTLTAIADTIRKKDGTQALIDPADYADRINLMGMLQEKTIVSSPIADFSDGADDVPTKSLIVTIPASLSGVSLVSEKQTGRNLFYVENSSLFPRDNNTIVDNIGTYTAWAKVKKNTDYYIKKSGNTNRQNVFGCTSAPAVGVSTYMLTRTEYATNEYRFNSGEYEYIGFYYSNEASENMMMSLSQDDVSNYEVYNGTSYTASLGRTIYGGTADIVNGSGEDTHGLITDFSTIRANGTSTSGAYRYIMDVSGMGDYNVGACVSNLLNYRIAWNADVGEFYNTANVLVVFLSQDNATDAINYLSSNSCKVAYPLATPTDFTFTGQEIPTRLGYNAFWSDEGDTEVTYRSSGTIHQYPEGEGVSF